jgi:hypothetical protein
MYNWTSKQQLPMANPRTHRRRRSKFSPSNVIPWRVGTILGACFGDLDGSVLVRDRLILANSRLGSDGLVFKSGDEEAPWSKSTIFLACWLSSETARQPGTLAEDGESGLFSIQ